MLIYSKIMIGLRKNGNYYYISKTMFMSYFNKIKKKALWIKDSKIISAKKRCFIES